jgi:hypothetical protein
MLTLVYIVTNAPVFVSELNEILMAFSNSLMRPIFFINWGEWAKDHHLQYVFIYVMVYNVCVLLNSTLNGCVFLIRTASIRHFIAERLERTVRSLRCGEDDPNPGVSNS